MSMAICEKAYNRFGKEDHFSLMKGTWVKKHIGAYSVEICELIWTIWQKIPQKGNQIVWR